MNDHNSYCYDRAHADIRKNLEEIQALLNSTIEKLEMIEAAEAERIDPCGVLGFSIPTYEEAVEAENKRVYARRKKLPIPPAPPRNPPGDICHRIKELRLLNSAMSHKDKTLRKLIYNTFKNRGIYVPPSTIRTSLTDFRDSVAVVVANKKEKKDEPIRTAPKDDGPSISGVFQSG